MPFQIHPQQTLSMLRPYKPVDQIAQKQSLLALQNMGRAGQIQDVQLQQEQGQLAAQQGQAQKTAQIQQILATAKWDDKGRMDGESLNKLRTVDPDHADKLVQAGLAQENIRNQMDNADRTRATAEGQLRATEQRNLDATAHDKEQERLAREKETREAAAGIKLTPGETLLRDGQAPYTAPIKPPNESFEESTYNDFLEDVPLTTKYGATRIGFAKWQQDQRVQQAQASRAVSSGLPPQSAQRVGQIASQFDSHPIVKNYNETINRLDTVNGILGGKMGGPGDLAIVFEFMKGLDPTSVVRESEYATAAKSGNIFSGWAAKFNGYLKPEGGFLPDRVKEDFMQVLDGKIKASQQQYRNLRTESARKIDKWTGGADGEEYLTEYEFGSHLNGRSTPADAAGGWKIISVK